MDKPVRETVIFPLMKPSRQERGSPEDGPLMRPESNRE